MSGRRLAEAAALLGLLAVMVALPLVASPFGLRVAQTLLFGAALAVAWNILGGFAGYWSFGNAAFLGLGAFVAALLGEHGGIDGPIARFVLCVAAGGGAAALLALIIGYPILRLRGTYFAIAMLGTSLVLAELSSSVDLLEGALGITLDPVSEAAPEIFFFYVLLALAVLSLVVAALVRYGRLGYGLIAIREDEDTARMLGVPTEPYKLLGFVLMALLTGLVGAAYAFSLGYITTSTVFRPDLSFSIIVYALLGGMGTLLGPALGAVVMTLLTQVVLGAFLQVHMMLTGLVIVALVFLLPRGLMGLFRARRGAPKVAGNALGGMRAAMDPDGGIRAAIEGAATAPSLRLVGLSKQYRGLRAIDGLDIEIRPGSISTIIGPNGAGKSTVFNTVTGYTPLTTGEVWFDDRRIDDLPTYRLSQLGIARVFQIAKPFADLTVRENVLVGALFGREGARDAAAVTADALALTGLSELADATAAALPAGHLRRLELARVVATRPRLVLADEPCAGLNPTETLEMMAILQAVRARGATVVLVEHDMHTVMSISDEVYVIAAGRLIAHGAPAAVVQDPAVIEAYLGKPLKPADLSAATEPANGAAEAARA